jgi:hypothetical protein
LASGAGGAATQAGMAPTCQPLPLRGGAAGAGVAGAAGLAAGALLVALGVAGLRAAGLALLAAGWAAAGCGPSQEALINAAAKSATRGARRARAQNCIFLCSLKNWPLAGIARWP